MNSLVIYSIIYALLFLGFYFRTICSPQEDLRTYGAHTSVLAGCGLIGLFILQLVITGFMPGHIQDTGLFRAWTAFANEHSLWEYYTTELYVDYPPVYLYVLYGIGKLTKLLGIVPTSGLYIVFVRSIPILFDGLTTLCIYVMAKSVIGEKKALVIAFLSAVNPTNILNSTLWGQVDSITAFMVTAMLLLLYKKKYVGSCTLFALLFLTKPQMIIFAPLMGFVFLFDIVEIWQNKDERSKILGQAGLSIVAMVAVLLLVPLPITGGNYSLLIANYQKALGLYPYATLNAANLYGALGANWAKHGDKFFIFSYKTWGFIFIVIASLVVGWGAWKSKDRRKIFYLGIFMVLAIYMLAHGMHERYMHPAFLLMLVAYVLNHDEKILLFYGAFSITTFLGCGAVMLLNQQNQFIYGDNMLFRLLSAVNVLLFVLFIMHGIRFWKKDGITRSVPVVHTKTEVVCNTKTFKLQPSAMPTRFKKIDYWLMLGLTVFYALFGFYHLGSNTVPESGWYVEKAGESIVLDLGSAEDVKKLYIHAGWIDRRQSDQAVSRDIKVECSFNERSWIEAETPMVLNKVFNWHVFKDFPQKCRYIRLTCDDGRFYMNEIALFGDSEEVRFIPRVRGNEDPAAQCVIDEPERVIYDFTWYDGTYFDEIYHPRTAYEFITHRYPYENTHPPLGKVIIACGMLLFGVNPFGWRFFGTLCGVLMVPLTYTMGKKMLKKTSYAFIVAFLFSFDFMHLAQTRLATIDSYTAFFVMGMYLFMYLYMEKNFYTDGIKATMLPLFASGLCFGLGAATKWQGIYAGIGLAVLFFYTLYRRYAEYRAALQSEPTAETAHVIQNFRPMAIKTIGAGFLFFVFIPAVIYFLSYIPAMMSESTGLSFFFTNQGSMLRYHSNLEATHSYGSSWWQWPFDYKPLYAYSPNRDFVPPTMSMGITSFGNPAIWWLTIPAVLWGIYQIYRQKSQVDSGILTAVVGFFSLYAPWMLVKRTAFIYHFFPCVIFVVLLIVFYLREKEQDRKWRFIGIAYMVLVFALFIMFYPVLTGMEIPVWYASMLRWVPGWVLG
ncbi:MAG: phospholipid carrier-dependent glycosyltransferase [Ruminococcaceae bacterium]|nr:phospholipid carrier-dependent glycosyltransferase [Oscillospiraceae bacterium]